MNAVTREKAELIEKLRVLLAVAGTQTAWSDLAASLQGMNVEMLRALEYRVRQTRTDAFVEGQRDQST